MKYLRYLQIFLASTCFMVACGVFPTGNSTTYNCSAAKAGSSIAQTFCVAASSVASASPSASASASVSASPSPLISVVISPSPYPSIVVSSTPASCTFSEQRVYATTSDLSAVFTENNVPYTKTVTSSTCYGISAGPAGSFTSTNINGDGTTININEFTGGFTISGTSLSWSTISGCVGTVLVTTTVTTGTIDVFPATNLTLDITYTYDPNGGC